MKEPTLDEFLVQGEKAWPKNSWVKEPGFTKLYVRLSKRSLEGGLRLMIDLSNLTARHPGKGTFTRLVARLRAQYPEMGIYVECVLEPRFAVRLVSKLGFKVSPFDERSFYLFGTSQRSPSPKQRTY